MRSVERVAEAVVRAFSHRRAQHFVLGTGVLILALGAAFADKVGTTPDPMVHEVRIVARSYAFDPPIIRIRRGDTLRLTFAATDVEHGFYLEGHDLDVTIPPLSREVEVKRGGRISSAQEVIVVADRAGKFRYRCSKTCGAMHPFMMGELIVGPNRLYRGAVAGAFGILFAALADAWWRPLRKEAA